MKRVILIGDHHQVSDSLSNDRPPTPALPPTSSSIPLTLTLTQMSEDSGYLSLISCYFPTRFHCVTDVRHSTFCHVIQQRFRHDIEQTEEMKCFNSVVSISGKLAKCREVAGSTIFRNYWLCTLIIL